MLAARAFECRALGLMVPVEVGWMDGLGVRLEADTSGGCCKGQGKNGGQVECRGRKFGLCFQVYE